MSPECRRFKVQEMHSGWYGVRDPGLPSWTKKGHQEVSLTSFKASFWYWRNKVSVMDLKRLYIVLSRPSKDPRPKVPLNTIRTPSISKIFWVKPRVFYHNNLQITSILDSKMRVIKHIIRATFDELVNSASYTKEVTILLPKARMIILLSTMRKTHSNS